jgi:DNA polymerase III delta prime subunit
MNPIHLINRQEQVDTVKRILKDFEATDNSKKAGIKRGIYVYGDSGSGKTTFVNQILKEMNYDIIRFDAGDIRNKRVIDTITKDYMADKNMMSMFYKKVQRIAIVMDEIDAMNNGEKSGIESLIKIIRPKKTLKQKDEEMTLNVIICIGNYHVDKKIKELMKVCHLVELKTPTKPEMMQLTRHILPMMSESVREDVVEYIEGDLRKLSCVCQLYKKNQADPDAWTSNMDILLKKSFNDNTRVITKKLIHHMHHMDEHVTMINETDRTTVGLLWHENIVDVLGKMKKEESVPLYLNILDNICFADYIDRKTFQKQIWQFNEMTSLIKTFKTHNLYHMHTAKSQKKKRIGDVRFTKVLTKYSTEFNNYTFTQELCQELMMDKNDMFVFFLYLKTKYKDIGDILTLFENNNITNIETKEMVRLYRYLDKYTTESVDAVEQEDSCDETDSVN